MVTFPTPLLRPDAFASPPIERLLSLPPRRPDLSAAAAPRPLVLRPPHPSMSPLTPPDSVCRVPCVVPRDSGVGGEGWMDLSGGKILNCSGQGSVRSRWEIRQALPPGCLLIAITRRRGGLKGVADRIGGRGWERLGGAWGGGTAAANAKANTRAKEAGGEVTGQERDSAVVRMDGVQPDSFCGEEPNGYTATASGKIGKIMAPGPDRGSHGKPPREIEGGRAIGGGGGAPCSTPPHSACTCRRMS